MADRIVCPVHGIPDCSPRRRPHTTGSATVAEVNRIAVIDHRHGGQGRVIDAWDCTVTLDYQDDGQTLKVFIRDAPDGADADA